MMRALLLKDLLSLKNQGKFYLIFVVGYGLISRKLDSLNLPIAMMIMLGGMLLATVMTWEERSNWERFALTMPVDRRTMVAEKYLFGVLAIFTGGLLAVLMVAVIGELSQELALSIVMLLGLGLVYVAVILPVFFKLGVEKARWVNFAVLFMPVFALTAFLDKVPAGSLERAAAFLQKYGALLGLGIVIAVMGFSYWLSCRIYAAKEF